MPGKSGDAAQAKLPSSTREVLQQHIAELGACSPATLAELAGEQRYRLRNGCGCGQCDICDGRRAVLGILEAIAETLQ